MTNTNIILPKIPKGYCWLIRWDEAEGEFFVHISKSIWIDKEPGHQPGHWIESYKAHALTVPLAFKMAFEKMNQVKGN